MSKSDEREPRDVLRRVLAWSRERSYEGYSKHDALNSPFLSACSLGLPLARLAFTQIVMRSPFNLRPLLGVPVGRNPKGIGLFAQAWLDFSQTLPEGPEKDRCLGEAWKLLAWLVHHSSPNARASERLRGLYPEAQGEPEGAGSPLVRRGMGWGYHYPWQDQGFFQPRHFPNRVVSCWIGFAFLRAHEITGDLRHLDACREIGAFLLENPRVLHEDEHQLCLSYVPLDDIRWAVMDVSALVAAFLARFRRRLGAGDASAEALASTARRLMAFVVDKQTDYGGWFYTWPSRDSHIKHDNYHTAIILDCLADYMADAEDRTWLSSYRLGLEYYREALFLPDGAPRWMNDQTYPHDIHGAASGILCFTRAAGSDPESAGRHLAWADTILDWTLRHLYDPAGFFYYQKRRLFTNRFCEMRWGNAWMCRALAQRLRINSGAPAAR